MRTFILTCAILGLNRTNAQETQNKYFFKEVGWSIILPADFNLVDASDDAARNERGKKAMEKANNVIADISQTRTLISATKNTYNYFNATITPFNPKEDGDYKFVNQQVKDIAYKTLFQKMPDAKIDSSTSIITIDGLVFDKYQLTIAIKNKVLFNMLLLTKFYKGFDFGITYLYLDEKTKDEMETMLQNSKFSKQ